MSSEIGDDGEPLFRKETPSPAALLLEVAAARKSIEEKMNYGDVATGLQDARPPSMAEQTVQLIGVPQHSRKGDPENSEVSVPLERQFGQGIGHCTSLQDLLIGFTNGTLCIVNTQQEHVVQGVPLAEGSCFEMERKDYYSNAECEFGALEICLEEGYVESEQDNEHEESSDGADSADSDTDHDEPIKDKIYPNERFGEC
ncbi:unnamed protein product [Miscanthus lutarioriparius]|uniref:Uncharacterized protein n=1 Tax=Miscanthus lutarioriparius TaxID=422564 RepID=A0A811PJJ8_9POAL|nr:unnamed protein product [Miscanthus lutarioriparius]